MNRSSIRAHRPLGLALLLFIAAPNAATAGSPCSERIDRASVVACAVEAGLALAAARSEESSARARLDAAGRVLPSNPELGATFGRRSAPNADAVLNWSATLSQTIEPFGQRGLRLDAADHDLHARRESTKRVRQRVAANGLAAYFEALSSLERLALAERLAAVAGALTQAADARAAGGMAPALDAAVAYAAGVQLLRARAEAEAGHENRRAALAVTLGLPATARPLLAGELTALPFDAVPLTALLAEAESQRNDLSELQAELEFSVARVAVLQRERWPNPTLSAFVQRDGFDELYWGAGVALSIPIPSPVGRTLAPEISEAEAAAQRAELELAARRREVGLEVAERAQALEAGRVELALFEPARMRQAEELLGALAEEIGAGRLGAREALAAEQALLELLNAHLHARRNVAIASVELALALGRDLEGSAP